MPSALPRSASPTNSSKLTRFGNKKRVRRIQRELSHFRLQVEGLKLTLTRLTLLKASPGVRLCCSGVGGLDRNISVWNDIAERQLKDRLRAEKQREELLESHTQLAQLSTELWKLLQKYHDEENLQVDAKQQGHYLAFLDLPAIADHEVYSQQLAIVAKLHLQLQQNQKPSRTLYFDAGLMRGETVVVRDRNVAVGICFEMHFGTMVPFALDVAAKAYWRFFQLEHGSHHSVGHSLDALSNTLTRSYSLRLDLEDFASNTSGKYTCRKYVSEGEIALVWVERADVLEFGRCKFHGLQYQKRGWIKLRAVPRQGPGRQSTSTVVETHFETTPIFHKSAVNPALQLEEFINSMRRSHTTMNRLVWDTMGRLLLEEDWKATFVD